jgi:adenine-specific DNA-methyltransferase
LTAKQSTKNQLGQYFTPEAVADFMIGLADISDQSEILEPSCGEGIFLELLQKKGFTRLTACEIDNMLASSFPFVRYESFVSAKIAGTFDLVIGNPPYIRWKNLKNDLKRELAENPLWNRYCNSLCDYLHIFIIKSIELLNDSGQLIFICPEYWMNTTHSLSLRNYMIANGCFEEIYHFSETPLFNRVTVSIIIFKYVKGKRKADKIGVSKFRAGQKPTAGILDGLKKRTPLDGAEYLEVAQFKTGERWILQTDAVREKLKLIEIICKKNTQNRPFDAVSDEKREWHTIGDFCDIGNGLVSGLDRAFQLNGDSLNDEEKTATMDVVKAKDLNPFRTGNITKYIYIRECLQEDALKEKYPHFFHHFRQYKTELNRRYRYNRKINYWEWVFPRNFKLFSRDEKRILVPCKERISNKNHFRFSLACKGIFPTQDVTGILKKANTRESIEYILAYLNSPCIFDWLKCNGIVKGNIVEFSEKPVASIPFKPVNWDNPEEVALHDMITALTARYIDTGEPSIAGRIHQLLNTLIGISK